MTPTSEQLTRLMDMLYKAAETVGFPDIGNRTDMEDEFGVGGPESMKVAQFFIEFGRLFAGHAAIGEAPNDEVTTFGMVMVPADELAALRDMAWRYQELAT